MSGTMPPHHGHFSLQPQAPANTRPQAPAQAQLTPGHSGFTRTNKVILLWVCYQKNIIWKEILLSTCLICFCFLFLFLFGFLFAFSFFCPKYVFLVFLCFPRLKKSLIFLFFFLIFYLVSFQFFWLTAGLPDCLTPDPACLTSWLLNCLTAWLLDCLTAWLPCFLTAWLLDCLISWLIDRPTAQLP